VDFTKQTVVVYGLGEMKHGGFAVRVKRADCHAGGFAVGSWSSNRVRTATTRPWRPRIPSSCDRATSSNIAFDEVVKRDTPPCTDRRFLKDQQEGPRKRPSSFSLCSVWHRTTPFRPDARL